MNEQFLYQLPISSLILCFRNDIGQNIANLKDNKINENPSASIHQYIPDKYPPDLEFARRHGKAKKVAKALQNYDGDISQSQSAIIDVCECCGLPIENEELPLCCDRTDMAEFGSGYPLYFEFVFYCIIMLIIMLLGQGIYGIVSNYKADDCYSHYDKIVKCDYWVNKISISNKLNSPDLYYAQTWVNFATIFLIMLSLHKFRRVQKLTERECDRGLVSPSDYTIIIQKLPPGKYNEKDIERLILDKIPTSSENNANVVIKKIVMGYHIAPFVQNCRSLNEIEAKIRKAKLYEQNHGKLPEKINLAELEQSCLDLKQKLEEYKNQINDEKSITDKTCGDVFVTFSTQGTTKEIVDRYEFSSLQKYFNYFKQCCCCDKSINDNKLHFRGELLYVQRAPEPNDVVWENLGFSNFFKFKRRVFTNFATLLVLAICFVLIFGVSYYQSKVAEDYKNTPIDKRDPAQHSWVQSLGYISSFLIVFINTCLLLSIRQFANLEKHSTITHMNISVAEKLTFAQFCNTAIITFLANYAIYSKQENWREQLFTDGGLVTDLSSIFISNAIIPIIMTYCNPWYLFRLYKRWKLEKEGEKSFTTQSEANEIYEGGPLDMAYKYGILCKTMWLTSFYSCILPMGIICSLINLILTYLLDKYLILRRYARTPLLSADLNRSMIESLEYCPFFMALGSFFFHLLLFETANIDKLADIIAMALTCVNFIFPAAEFNDYFCAPKEEELSDLTPYDDAMRRFASDYDRANPITREKAMNEWVSLVEGGSPLMTSKEKKSAGDEKFGNGLQDYAKGYQAGYQNLMQKMIIKNKKHRQSKELNPITNNANNVENPNPQYNQNPDPQYNQNPNPIYPNENQMGNINQYPNLNQPPGYYQQTNIFGPQFVPTNQPVNNIFGQPLPPPPQNFYGQNYDGQNYGGN